MRTLKLTLAYDGTNYHGWQSQPDRVTLQETLERALARIAGEEIRVMASGRTDAGVHAFGQVVSLRTNCPLAADRLARALNSELPRDMAVLAVADADDDFHAIASAKSKRYRYVLEDGPVRDVFSRAYAWYSHLPLAVDAMSRAARPLVGCHDFASFQSSGSERQSTVRTVLDLSVARACRPFDQGCLPRSAAAPPPAEATGSRAAFVVVEIEADGFLYNMVRAIVGTLVEVGQGKRGEAWPAAVLAAADRRRAGRTAPSHGLFLMGVRY